MKDKTRIELLSSEVAGLWTTYLSDSLSVCMLKYFLNKLEDEEYRHAIELALNTSNGHLQVVRDKFNQDGLPIPKGFGEDDVDIDAPKLFADSFYMLYLVNMAQYGMLNYTLILNHAARPDIRDFFTKCISEATEVFNLSANILEQQGLYTKAPRVEFNKEIDFIDDQKFFSGGWFGKKRSLAATEITYIFANVRQNIIGEAIVSAFGQVAKSKKTSDYFYRGRDLAWKKIVTLNTFFSDEHIPIPSTSESFIKDSTVAPFSDRLMLNHIVLYAAAAMSQEGISLANSMRHDIQAHFSDSMLESGKYMEDGIDILIENKWFEQPPLAIESKNLVKD
jgi:hypothetical protein